MNAQRVKAFVVLLLALMAFAVAHAWRPSARMADTRGKVDLETMFPKSFGHWTVDERMPVQLVSPDTQAILNKIYNQTLSRTYVNARGERIMLSVAYGGDQSDGTRAHRPEVCYPAQGFQVNSESAAGLKLPGDGLRVRRLVAKLGGRVEPITYWITVGEHIVLTGTEQKLAQLSYSVRGVIPDGMLVRVSSISTEPGPAFALQEQFVLEMSASMPRASLPRIFGAGVVAASLTN